MPKPITKNLPLSKLSVDPQVQRNLDRVRVGKIASMLDLDAIGTLVVSDRGNGSTFIIDGQHRAEALRVAGYASYSVPCQVFTGLTVAEEAAMFRLLNNTKKPSAVDLFRVRAVEGDPIVVGILDILDQHGWKIPHSLSWGNGCINAVGVLERIYKAGADNAGRDVLNKTIATITAAWGHDKNGGDGRIIEGLGMVYLRYGQAVHQDELADRLAKYRGGPGSLVGRALGLHDLLRTRASHAMAELIVELYNQRRKTRALPSWRAQ